LAATFHFFRIRSDARFQIRSESRGGPSFECLRSGGTKAAVARAIAGGRRLSCRRRPNTAFLGSAVASCLQRLQREDVSLTSSMANFRRETLCHRSIPLTSLG
jgi:hypothetical protein